MLNVKTDEETIFLDDWACVVDLNQAFQNLMMSKWATEEVPKGDEVFNTYKARMYSLAIVGKVKL